MFIKNFSDFNSINEWVNNQSLSRFHIRDIIGKIQKKLKHKIKNTDLKVINRNEHKLHYIISNIVEYELFEKMLKQHQENLLERGIVLGYSKYIYSPIKKVKDNLDIIYDNNIKLAEFNIIVKDLYTTRIKPPRYIYHVSPSYNRNEILKHGLKTTSWEDGSWLLEIDLYYPKAVFAIPDFSYWVNNVKDKDPDIWEIDTKNLDNKWQEDLNFYKKNNDIKAFMTFKDIPKDNIRLVTKEEIDKLYFF
jgi:hypothetical protein